MSSDEVEMIKKVDSKGRLTLGSSFAFKTVLVKSTSKNEFVVKIARVIPEDEMWLHENKEAMASVQQGIAGAAAGKLVEGPDLDADSEFADSIEDD